MLRKIAVSTLSVIALATSAYAAGEFGTAAEARAMLDSAVVAVEANQEEALAMFANGDGGFKDRDLYPFCGGPDGNFSAHPSLTGKSLMDLQDKAGAPLGEEIYNSASEGEVSEVSYMWPRPDTTEPVQKVTFVTKIGDQVCAVGYYQ